MAENYRYEEDIKIILSHRFDLGSDYWTTADKRLLKGSPFIKKEDRALLPPSAIRKYLPI